MDQQIHDILVNSVFFKGLSPESLACIEPITRRVKYKAGQTIFREGDPCPGIFVVGSGAVRVYKLATSGKEHVLHFVYPGMTFAEVAAIGQFNCPAFAEAIEDTVCALVAKDGFIRALHSNHDLCLQLMESMAYWVRQLVGHLEDIVLRDAVGRVAQHLIKVGSPTYDVEFALPTLKKDLASHLNLTSETLSRTLRRLADAGMIDMPDQHHLRILNRKALIETAQGILPAEFV
ncbi:MAG: Crp/Fnr family transcriptional regulator [Planctomycetota bacterium]|jgi:CRP/FNR family transcriptional regulator